MYGSRYCKYWSVLASAKPRKEIEMTYEELVERSKYVKTIIPDEESFNDILNTFYEDEVRDLDSDEYFTKNMRVLHILARATDLITKRSSYTEDDVLHLTGESSSMELPVAPELKQLFLLCNAKTINAVLKLSLAPELMGSIFDGLDKLTLDETVDLSLDDSTELGKIYTRYRDKLLRSYSLVRVAEWDTSDEYEGLEGGRELWVIQHAL